MKDSRRGEKRSVMKRRRRERRHKENIRKFVAQFETEEKRFLEKGILGKMKNRRKTGLQNMKSLLRKKIEI